MLYRQISKLICILTCYLTFYSIPLAAQEKKLTVGTNGKVSYNLSIDETVHRGSLALGLANEASDNLDFSKISTQVVENPLRLVIDLPAPANGKNQTLATLGSPLIKSLRIGNHPDKLRFVIDFDQGFKAKDSGSLKIEKALEKKSAIITFSVASVSTEKIAIDSPPFISPQLTPAVTATAKATNTVLVISSSTAIPLSTASPAHTVVSSNTVSPKSTVTPANTSLPVNTVSINQTALPTKTATPTRTATTSPTLTTVATPSQVPTVSASIISTAVVATAASTSVPTQAALASPTTTTKPSKTPTVTRTPTPSRTPRLTKTPTPTRTPSPTKTLAPILTPTSTATVTITATAVPSIVPTLAVTAGLTATSTPLPTKVPTELATISATATSAVAPEVVSFGDSGPQADGPQSVEQIAFEYQQPDSLPVIKLRLTQRPQFKLVKRDDGTFILTVPSCEVTKKSLSLPQFPPQDFVGFRFIQANEVNKSCEVLIGVDKGTRIAAFARESDILIRSIGFSQR